MAHPTQPARILVVDDEPLLRDLLVDILESSGHQAVAADGGARAIDALARQSFQLVISDIRMPEIDGFALLSHIRATYPSLPVFLVSAFVPEQEASMAQPDGFLSKPFRINQIEEMITQILTTGRTARAAAPQQQQPAAAAKQSD